MGIRKLQTNTSGILDIEGHQIELPVIEGSEGEKGLDIGRLRANTGYVCVDPGFVNTASCLSQITYLDGEKGVLHYRGHPIEDLAENANFLEVSFLLIYGEMPNPTELKQFQNDIAQNSKTTQFISSIGKALPKDTHPMGILSSLMVALSADKPELVKQDLSADERNLAVHHIMAQIKNLTAMCYRVNKGLDFVPSDPGADYVEDFYTMTFKGTEHESLSPVVKDALNTLLILHADHEQNCSTSSVRLVGSSKANPYASIASGINALWGPLHGGANQAVIEMLEQMHADGGGYKKFVEKAKDKNDPFRLMGFGHRVYKNFDPRAQIIKKACDKVLNQLGITDPLLDLAKGLEKEALSDPYFIERKLYPNVDFYSGIIYKALNIPNQMFTAMFALGRLPGWLAQWKEMLEDPKMKIGRPRQIYQGKSLPSEEE
ncbi:MAG: citrate synthase [Oligoflexales bacterium]|nr:citrate synthase [Oligoflexales bacterium]